MTGDIHGQPETPRYPVPTLPDDGLSVEERNCKEARDAAGRMGFPAPSCYCGFHEQNPPCPD